MNETNSEPAAQLTVLVLRHVSSRLRFANVTVDRSGTIVSSSGFDEDDNITAVIGFVTDSGSAAELDLSAAFALTRDPQLAIGMTPVVDTERGRSTLLFTVFSAEAR